MIHIGDKVQTPRGDSLVVGIVKDIYDFERGKLYIVNIGGELVKRREAELEVVPKETPKQTPTEITLTREEFRRKFMAALDPNKYDFEDPTTHIAVFVSGMTILDKLEKDLFGEK